jgi:hypothetical protein
MNLFSKKRDKLEKCLLLFFPYDFGNKKNKGLTRKTFQLKSEKDEEKENFIDIH